MLDTIDLGRELDKSAYKEWFPRLEMDLSILQRKAFESGLPVVIVFEGWDASGKGDAISKIVHNLDPRGFRVHRIGPATDEEQLHPFLWRFWTRLPPDGGIGFFDRSWYSRVLIERMDGEVKRREWQQAYQEINQFERQLVDDGHVLIKFFLHISKKEQKKRFRQIETIPAESWRVTKDDWRHHKQYDDYLQLTEEMLERTSTSYAPWTVVEATDRRFRRVKILQTVASAIQEGLEAQARKKQIAEAGKPEPKEETEPVPSLHGIPSILDRVDLSVALERKDYRTELKGLQKQLREMEFECYRHRTPVIIAYEGWDAAGKGGNIKRLTDMLDPRGYDVIPISAPKGDEATHHYLWRFWKNIPKAGHIAIFDRTWYGRVLVERVEGFIGPDEWQRAYQEINEFEQSLTQFGAVVVKFWLHLSKDEQLARFEERQKVPHKNYKITDEDWRNREKWDDYEIAVTEMLERTSTSYAPWTIVEGNNKLWARIKALRTVVDAVAQRLQNT